MRDLPRITRLRSKHVLSERCQLDDQASKQINELPWNIKRACKQIKDDAWRYLLDVGHFTREHTIKAGKILSFHAKAVACVKKGKIGKDFEFGRAFQLGRIKGNFLFVLESISVRMNDKTSFIPLLAEHVKLFGEGTIETAATDKGYWSAKNRTELIRLGIKTEGLQKPSNIKSKKRDPDLEERLRNRRAGIEPLIGHAKLAEGHSEATVRCRMELVNSSPRPIRRFAPQGRLWQATGLSWV